MMKRGKEMSKAGRDHLKFLNDVLAKKDYLAPIEAHPEVIGARDDWSNKRIDEAIDTKQFEMAMYDLTLHKQECPGCSKDMLADLRQKAQALARR
jgi:hypothetical protein